jgi:predicted small lipoprotein YifL
MIRKWILAIAILAMAASLGTCGRKAKPETPEGSHFPRTYPTE